MLKEGLAANPDYAGYYDQLGYVLRYAGLMSESIENYQRAQELDRRVENLVSTQDQITKSLTYLGRYQDAMSSHLRMESFMTRAGKTPDEKEWFYKGVIHLYAGDRGQVATVLAELERLVVVDGERHYRLVHLACFLGEYDRALSHLATSIRGGFFNAPYIAEDPMTAELRSHPGFTKLLKEAEDRHSAFRFRAQAAGESTKR